MRVNELAKELGVPSGQILATAKDLGMGLTHHSNSLSDEQVSLLKGKATSGPREGAAASSPPTTPASPPSPPPAATPPAASASNGEKSAAQPTPAPPSAPKPTVVLKPAAGGPGQKPAVILRPASTPTVKPAGPSAAASAPSTAPAAKTPTLQRPPGPGNPAPTTPKPGPQQGGRGLTAAEEHQKRILNLQRQQSADRGPSVTPGSAKPQAPANSPASAARPRPPAPQARPSAPSSTPGTGGGANRPATPPTSRQRPPRPGGPGSPDGPRFFIPGPTPRGYVAPPTETAAPPPPATEAPAISQTIHEQQIPHEAPAQVESAAPQVQEQTQAPVQETSTQVQEAPPPTQEKRIEPRGEERGPRRDDRGGGRSGDRRGPQGGGGRDERDPRTGSPVYRPGQYNPPGAAESGRSMPPSGGSPVYRPGQPGGGGGDRGGSPVYRPQNNGPRPGAGGGRGPGGEITVDNFSGFRTDLANQRREGGGGPRQGQDRPASGPYRPGPTSGPPPPLQRGGGQPMAGAPPPLETGGRGQGKKLISGESRRPPKSRGGGQGKGGPGAGRSRGGGGAAPPQINSSTEFRHVKDRRRRGGRMVEEPRVEVRRNVAIPDYITIKDLSAQTGVKSSEIIKYLFRELNIMATINHPVDQETAALICEHLGIEYTFAELEDTESTVESWILEEDPPGSLVPRPPVVTVMGHVDHGKTKLLDAIRSTNVVAGESGGITQHIGAYRAFLNGKQLTFLDTPGHQAFTAMRARGAKVTDIAVLVVAADDGVMPTTKEAIDHARAAGVEIIVALNKVDKHDANIEKVMTELSNEGLQPSEWGGTTTVVPVSALKQTGIQDLLEMILLQADVMDLKANPDRRAVGTIVEARLDKGRGPVATVLIEKGTLHQGDYVVIGACMGRIRAMQDENGIPIVDAGPSCPVEISGLSDVPQAGDKLIEVEDEKTARAIYDERMSNFRQARLKAVNKISLEDFHKRLTEGEVKELNIIMKSDVQGSIEAIHHALNQLNTSEVKVNIISAQVGNVKDSDIMLALASKSIIIGFKVQASPEIMKDAAHEGVDVRLYDIIYDAVDDIKKALAGLLKPIISEKITGTATVRAIFKVAKGATIGGCFIESGELIRNKKIRILRNGEQIFEGVLNGLKRFKEDARKVEAGYECGIEIDGITTLAEGDTIEQFEIEETARTLD